MFILKLQQLFLLSHILWVPTLASVGFEFELPEFQVYSIKNPKSIIPKRTQLAKIPGNLWSMTADETENGNDLEVVTVPFNKFDNSDGAQKLTMVSKDLKDYLLSLFKAGQKTQKKKQVDFPSLTANKNYALTFSAYVSKGSDAYVAPQVTFGILPSHFYHLSCGFLNEKEIEPEFLKYIYPNSKLEFQVSYCRDLERIFQKPIFNNLPKNIDSTLRSFLTLFRQYVTKKSTKPLNYPKLVTGLFLSRVSFAEMFHQLPQEVKDIIIKADLLREIVRNERKGWKIDKEMVFPFGYKSTASPAGVHIAKGPTLEAWIEGFTRKDNPVDLLAKLDEDESMGQMPLDSLATTVGGELQKHWILELRGLPTLSVNDIPVLMEELFQFFSNFNGKKI